MDKCTRNAGARLAIREMQRKLRDMCLELDRSEGMPDRFKCLHCLKPCFEEYMVHNSVWAKALSGYASHLKHRDLSGYLHLKCLEQKLGRKLHRTDFTNAPINAALHHMLLNEREFLKGWWELENAAGCRYQEYSALGDAFGDGAPYRFDEEDLLPTRSGSGEPYEDGLSTVERIKKEYRAQGPFELVRVSRYRRSK